MTNNRQPAKSNLNELIRSCQKKFSEFGLLDFKNEAIFAMQQCTSKDLLQKVATNNPISLRMAMLNVAAVGLSLNPAQGLAYLVPRDGRVILDISYRGLIALAVDTGAIGWAKAELVYENDQFMYKGPVAVPEHNCDPFSTDRGAVRGGYCVAKLTSGDYMVEPMSYADMEKIRMSSPAGKDGKGPWATWEDQMQLKSVVKRAYKWWPKPSPRLSEAVRILNEENGEGLSELKTVTSQEAILQALPEPAKHDEVSDSTRQLVQHLLNRVSANGAFESCREIAQSRVKAPAELAYALDELDRAKQAFQENISGMQQTLV